MKKYKDREFNKIIREIKYNQEFKKTKEKKHHGITRYEHCLRVAYYTYKVTKKLKLNYKEATFAAMLHDFFIDEVKDENGYKRLILHPKHSLNNSTKYFELTKLQKDIIIKHMFPITIKPPIYIESWIVDLIDDITSIYERIYAFSLSK